jgi:predicted SAM-dependent methyltransferase
MALIHRARRAAGDLRAKTGDRWRRARRLMLEKRLRAQRIRKVNLCSGSQKVPGYFAVDSIAGADLRIDLSTMNLPFADSSLEIVVCMSAINYFKRERAKELVREIHRALQPGGVCRVGVQDLRSLAERYVRGDDEFFCQKLPDGRDRFEGPTIGDKFVAWFYGYAIGSNRCQYFYDFDSLAYLFREAGFRIVERKEYRESRIDEVQQLDNRPEQMFFLEAVK